MSRKNHKLVDGRLLQTDKKYSHLKLKQKEKSMRGCLRKQIVIMIKMEDVRIKRRRMPLL